ncbi:MAG: hypothetical protein QF464_07650 [Myxococcota bacterium]|nr:hypothetical protein [Myxococcota bacterium]
MLSLGSRDAASVCASTSRLVVLSLLTMAVGVGCPSSKSGMQLYAAGLTAGDVNGVLYEVVCDNGITATEYVPMDPSGLPSHVDDDLDGPDPGS